MRYAIGHKAETHAKVLREASRQIRDVGPANVAVAKVMAQVGLTQGGFYSHFASKNALVIEAVDAMFEDALERSHQVERKGVGRATLLEYIDWYLSRAHRDARDRGCPLPALSGDFARCADSARDRFEAGLMMLTERLTASVAELGLASPEIRASAIMSQMVGAVVLARATTGSASDAILANARSSLISQYGLEEAA